MKFKSIKLWALALTLVLSLGMITACGGDKEKPDDTEKAPAEDAEEKSEEAEPEEEPEDYYAKTTADATGVLDFDTLKAGYDWLDNATSYDGEDRNPTYEEVRENFGGADGMKDGMWDKERHAYLWQTDGKADFVLVTFKVGKEGAEVWCGSSWSSSLSND